MTNINYREQINRESILCEDLINCGHDNNEELVPKSCVDWILDDIEGKINIIEDSLSNIYGLTEIDEIKDLVRELGNKLY